MFEKLTKKISGVTKSRDAGDEMRDEMINLSMETEDHDTALRYHSCAGCPHLKEEFKLLGKTVKEETPTCGECGCNLLWKIPLLSEKCPIGEW